MQICRICKMPISGIVDLANDNAEPIVIPDDEILSRQSTIHRLAMAYREKGKDDGTGRRMILNFVSDHLHGCKREVIHKGRKVEVDIDVDEAFALDASERWMSSFLAFGVTLPRQRAQRRVIYRITLLWLALAIHNPSQAELVVR